MAVRQAGHRLRALVAGGAGLTYLHPLLLLFLAIAIWGLIRRRRGLILAGLAGIFAISWQPVLWLALRPLECWYPTSPPAIGDAEAIVVLASGVLPAKGGRPEPVVGSDTYERCAYGAWMYSRKPLPLLVAGGPTTGVPVPAAVLMRKALVTLGVPESMVWVEDRSHSTYENALYSAEILRQKGIRRIVLVTKSYHMPRSERCFRKQGLSVIPAPLGSQALLSSPEDLIPDGADMIENENALHEYVGLGWYAIRGRI